jgi:hypothetical protein
MASAGSVHTPFLSVMWIGDEKVSITVVGGGGSIRFPRGPNWPDFDRVNVFHENRVEKSFFMG